MIRHIFFLILLLTQFSVSANDSIRYNLKGRWVVTNSAFERSTIATFRLNPEDLGVLEVNGESEFDFYIERHLLMGNRKNLRIDLDSLRGGFVFPISITLYCKGGIEGVDATLIKTNSNPSFSRIPLDGPYNASIIMSLVIALLLVAIIITSGHTLLEYLDLKSLVSLRSIDDSTFSQRITSLNNVLIYFLTALLIAVNLINIDLEADALKVLLSMVILVFAILVFYLAKIFLIALISKIYGVFDFAPGQFFLFVKFVLFSISLLTILHLLDFAFGLSILGHVTSLVYLFLVAFAYIIITIFRLINRGGLTVFHLFSYLCLSEIFPTIILLKII